jgi:hypothetical protein
MFRENSRGNCVFLCITLIFTAHPPFLPLWYIVYPFNFKFPFIIPLSFFVFHIFCLGTLFQCILPREYELLTEAYAKLSVVRKCSKSSVRVCLGEGNQLAGEGWSAVAGGGGRRGEDRQYTGRENLEQFPTTES